MRSRCFEQQRSSEWSGPILTEEYVGRGETAAGERDGRKSRFVRRMAKLGEHPLGERSSGLDPGQVLTSEVATSQHPSESVHRLQETSDITVSERPADMPPA